MEAQLIMSVMYNLPLPPTPESSLWQIKQKASLNNMAPSRAADKKDKSVWLFQQSLGACSSQLTEWLQ